MRGFFSYSLPQSKIKQAKIAKDKQAKPFQPPGVILEFGSSADICLVMFFAVRSFYGYNLHSLFRIVCSFSNPGHHLH
jgi:hypothetical protein